MMGEEYIYKNYSNKEDKINITRTDFVNSGSYGSTCQSRCIPFFKW